MSSHTRDVFSIHPEDPLSARGEVVTSAGYTRGDWQVETRGRTVLTSTAATFELEATLDAYEGGVRVFAKNWRVSIPRDNV
jgi:uncharacterized protein